MQLAPRLIDDATVVRLLSPAAVLGVIRGAFVGPPSAPPRLAASIDEGNGHSRTLLAMPAMRRGGLATVKVVSVQHADAVRLASYLIAMDCNGRLLAVIAAHSLTTLRTAAASVLAAKALGAGQAQRLAVIGAGRQARAQIEAFADAMPLAAITVWARRHEAAENLADFAGKFGVAVHVASSPGDAVHGADLVTCATGSNAPLILSSNVAPGTHIDLVGGFRPNMREADDALVARAAVVADCAAALDEAGDLLGPIANGSIKRGDIQLLGDVLAGEPFVKRGDVSVFKSVGHAAEDLVVTELLLERLGREGDND